MKPHRRGFLACLAGLAVTPVVAKPVEPPAVQEVGIGLTPEQRAELTETIKRHYRGVTVYSEPLILSGVISYAR